MSISLTEKASSSEVPAFSCNRHTHTQLSYQGAQSMHHNQVLSAETSVQEP